MEQGPAAIARPPVRASALTIAAESTANARGGPAAPRTIPARRTGSARSSRWGLELLAKRGRKRRLAGEAPGHVERRHVDRLKRQGPGELRAPGPLIQLGCRIISSLSAPGKFG